MVCASQFESLWEVGLFTPDLKIEISLNYRLNIRFPVGEIKRSVNELSEPEIEPKNKIGVIFRKNITPDFLKFDF